MKSGNLNFLEPSGPLQACNGTALSFPLRRVKHLAIKAYVGVKVHLQGYLLLSLDVCGPPHAEGKIPPSHPYSTHRIESGWAVERVWTFWIKGKTHVPDGKTPRFLGNSACSLVTISDELWWRMLMCVHTSVCVACDVIQVPVPLV